ncbi:sugar ABC transporter ATP-binding protein, partial [Escherichia coli]|uniref:ATP-binding cassette domain-containing protein n=1 Tax=Escherichia coli TaxID=562 RepID=UPI00128C9A50
EIFGISGLIGAGRTELLRLIYGADTPDAGMIAVGQPLKPAQIASPVDAVKLGIALITEDRKGEGLLLSQSITANVSLGQLDRLARGGVVDSARETALAEQQIDTLRIRTHGAAQAVGELSGGNQQKVLLSRLLETKPRVLILDEPTRGVDIGAKSEIYRIINELARAGVGVIVISSELPEIIGVADRVLVMREGEIAGELGGHTHTPITQEAIIALATGSQTELADAH